MNRLPRLVAALAVKDLTHLVALVWVSTIALLCLAFRVDVIDAVGPRYWLMTVLPLFALLHVVWISLVGMVRRNELTPHDVRRTRRPAERAEKE
jgi:hypothetical protein